MSPSDDIGDVRDDLNEVRGDIGTLQVEVANLRGDLREGLSEIKGSTSNIASSVDHVQRELEQRLTWHGELLKQHNDTITTLTAMVNENREKAALDASAVRVGLEAQIDNVEAGLRRDISSVETALGGRVTTLETWQAGVKGSWKAIAAATSVVTAVLVSAIGSFITYAINH